MITEEQLITILTYEYEPDAMGVIRLLVDEYRGLLSALRSEREARMHAYDEAKCARILKETRAAMRSWLLYADEITNVRDAFNGEKWERLSKVDAETI